MKVKKFRIRSRLPSVARILKSLLSIKQLPSELEESLPKESESLLAHVMPAASYHTWNRDELPLELHGAVEAAGAEKALAVTAVIATIGSSAEDALSELLLNGETVKAQVVTALAEDAADASFQFALRLLADDAKNDDCEVSDPVPVTGALLSHVLGLLEAQQDGITVDPAFHLSPRFTRVALAFWWPVAKKKRSAVLPKKKTA